MQGIEHFYNIYKAKFYLFYWLKIVYLKKKINKYIIASFIVKYDVSSIV